MILMIAPAPNMAFGTMPSGAAYISDQFSLVKLVNNSPDDQTALREAGCATLTPFGNWGQLGFLTLVDLYAADLASNLVLVGTVGFPQHVIGSVFADGANSGTWAKTGTGHGSGNWTQVSTLTLESLVTYSLAAAASATQAGVSAAAAATSLAGAVQQAGLAQHDADRAGEILASQMADATGIYPDLATGAAATPADGDKQGYFFVGAQDKLSGARNVGGVGTELFTFSTQRALKQMVSEGLPILSMGTESAVTNEASDYIKEFMELAATFGGGKLIFPGKGYVFQCGGDPVTFGTRTFTKSGETTTNTVPFNRGLIPFKSNVTLSGSGAKLLLAPGYVDPPSLFFNPFWTSVPQTDFHLEGLELDGNQANQIIYGVNANDESSVWLHGSGVQFIGASNVSARKCIFRNWRGMAMGGGNAPDYGLSGIGGIVLRENEFVDNFNGSLQVNGHRIWTGYNWHHGSGGWTAFIDIEVEGEMAGYDMLDIWSVNEIFDGRDGLCPPESFIHHYASDSADALAARVAYRRGYCLSGNYTADSNPSGVFNGRKGRVSVIHSKHWQTNISCGGVAKAIIDSPTIENYYEANATLMYPNDLNAISASPANNLNSGTGLSEFKVHNATIKHDMPAYGFFAGGYEWVEFSGTITGGRRSGIRWENCAGKIDARVRNIGGIADTTGDTPEDTAVLVGTMSSGVVIFGQKGPIEINLHVVDDRGAGAVMKYAAYVNSSATNMCNVTIKGQKGMLIGGVHDVANSTLVEDRSTLTPTINRKVTHTAGLEVHGAVDFYSDAGDDMLTLHAAAGSNNLISFFNGGVYHGQMAQRPDGGIQFNIIRSSDGQASTPVQLTPAGGFVISGTWDKPLQTTHGYLWTSAAGVLRYSGGVPSSDADGVAVGSQS